MNFSKETVNSGISFTFDNYSEFFSFSKKFVNVIARILIVIGLSSAIIYGFTSMMNINVNSLIVVLVLVFSSVVFSLLFYGLKKKMLILTHINLLKAGTLSEHLRIGNQ